MHVRRHSRRAAGGEQKRDDTDLYPWHLSAERRRSRRLAELPSADDVLLQGLAPNAPAARFALRSRFRSGPLPLPPPLPLPEIRSGQREAGTGAGAGRTGSRG